MHNIQEETTEYKAPLESRQPMVCFERLWAERAERECLFVKIWYVCSLHDTDTPAATYSEMKHWVDEKKDI